MSSLAIAHDELDPNEIDQSLITDRFLDGDSCCSDASYCPAPTPMTRATPKVGRNDPCPCDSGRKFKKCCGQ